MNIPKIVDHSNLFAGIDQILNQELPQMELYFEFGGLLDSQQETSSVTAAAKYLAEQYTDLHGFSPRSLRRMRAFYRTYKDQPSILNKAMSIGWTQNIVIFEACLTEAEREWYILAVRKFSWSKLELLRKITEEAHLKESDIPDTNTDGGTLYSDEAISDRAALRFVRKPHKMDDACLTPLGTPVDPLVRGVVLHHLFASKIMDSGICMPTIRPIEVLNDIGQIGKLCWQKHEPVFLVKADCVNLVIMSVETYERQIEVLGALPKAVRCEETEKGMRFPAGRRRFLPENAESV